MLESGSPRTDSRKGGHILPPPMVLRLIGEEGVKQISNGLKILMVNSDARRSHRFGFERLPGLPPDAMMQDDPPAVVASTGNVPASRARFQ